mmetsp:Transcript_24673/g.93303  ORF Transcript_24673/g.93303 Transcript_24673/m.93303 type:complete len:211 (-) Transcript_24673:581-1213(-)
MPGPPPMAAPTLTTLPAPQLPQSQRSTSTRRERSWWWLQPLAGPRCDGRLRPGRGSPRWRGGQPTRPRAWGARPQRPPGQAAPPMARWRRGTLKRLSAWVRRSAACSSRTTPPPSRTRASGRTACPSARACSWPRRCFGARAEHRPTPLLARPTAENGLCSGTTPEGSPRCALRTCAVPGARSQWTPPPSPAPSNLHGRSSRRPTRPCTP